MSAVNESSFKAARAESRLRTRVITDLRKHGAGYSLILIDDLCELTLCVLLVRVLLDVSLAKEVTMETGKDYMETGKEYLEQAQRHAPEPSEDEFTKTVEKYTAAVPSSAYLAVAVGAMGLSLLFQLSGRGKWGNFVAQWVPTLLIIGLYNKMVKLEGHDRSHRGGVGYSS